MLKTLFVAINRPFSSRPLRCCNNAFRGTAKKPPENPKKTSAHAAQLNEGCAAKSPTENIPMPTAPRGTSPSSILSLDKRPAARLPAPMPIAAKVHSSPMRVSPSCRISFPNRGKTIWRNAPKNQK